MTATISPITIIGAGLSGLTLGLSLKHKGIPTVIFDRSASASRYNYGIVLRSKSYRSLLGMLRMDEATFRAQTAVDPQQGGTHEEARGTRLSPEFFRCHRTRLEDLLRKDLSISWGKKLADLKIDDTSKKLTVSFEDGEQHTTTCLIGCDGPHSMTRQCLSPNMKLSVLPFVVFNGKRDISHDVYKDRIQKYLGENASVQMLKGDIRLEISVNDVNESSVSLRYTYSRPARAQNDPIHKPDRSNAAAKDIPEEFFTEVADLKGLPAPFNEIFNVEELRKDRLLHWLMRTVSPDLADLGRLAELDVALIGDAVHATPIVGSEGANLAIQDGIYLAEYLASRNNVDLKEFSGSKFEMWRTAVHESQERIKDMHVQDSALI